MYFHDARESSLTHEELSQFEHAVPPIRIYSDISKKYVCLTMAGMQKELVRRARCMADGRATMLWP